jgi:hypothetical protein
VEEVAAFAEDTAEDFGDGEDELAVRDFVADGGGDPIGGLADAALVAGRAEVAGSCSARASAHPVNWRSAQRWASMDGCE